MGDIVNDQDRPLPFTRDAWIAYAMFLLYCLAWYGASSLFGVSPQEMVFWLVAVCMSAAHIYYVIQAYASTGGRRGMDLVLNFMQATATTLLIMAHIGRAISVRTSLLLVGAVAVTHPIVTDWHHMRRYFRTEVASYVPPACILVDFSAAGLAVVAMAF